MISRSYRRKEEYAADRHGAEILERAGYSKDVMIGRSDRSADEGLVRSSEPGSLFDTLLDDRPLAH
jgi:predicted Zn-dependent protease